jgi:hypothetical protein
MANIDWNQKAKQAAELVNRQLTQAHLGTLVWHVPTNTLLAFGTRGDPQRQVPILKDRFEAFGIPVRAVATSDDGCTFVMLLQTTDAETVTDCLWDVVWEVSEGTSELSRQGVETVQRRIAAERIGRFVSEVENWWDILQ